MVWDFNLLLLFLNWLDHRHSFLYWVINLIIHGVLLFLFILAMVICIISFFLYWFWLLFNIVDAFIIFLFCFRLYWNLFYNNFWLSFLRFIRFNRFRLFNRCLFNRFFYFSSSFCWCFVRSNIIN